MSRSQISAFPHPLKSPECKQSEKTKAEGSPPVSLTVISIRGKEVWRHEEEFMEKSIIPLVPGLEYFCIASWLADVHLSQIHTPAADFSEEGGYVSGGERRGNTGRMKQRMIQTQEERWKWGLRRKQPVITGRLWLSRPFPWSAPVCCSIWTLAAPPQCAAEPERRRDVLLMTRWCLSAGGQVCRVEWVDLNKIVLVPNACCQGKCLIGTKANYGLYPDIMFAVHFMRELSHPLIFQRSPHRAFVCQLHCWEAQETVHRNLWG